jgi:hypothetical protein
MIGRTVIGTVLGAIVLYVWAMISWMVLPWHNATMAPVADETAAMAVARETMSGAGGLYYFSVHAGRLVRRAGDG